MTGGERVEDTRTLKPGDRVRVIVDTTVDHVSEHSITLPIGSAAHFLLRHGQTSVEVYRLPKPLPPELVPGREVLGTSSRQVWRHMKCEPGAECPPPCAGHYWTCAGLIGRYTWAEVLKREGSVRLLGDPIEAPR